MAHVTVSFPPELRELSLHPNFKLSPTRFHRAFRLDFTVKETRDRMVEQRKMDTASPCSSTNSLNPESRIRSGPQPARKRESLRRKQAHHKLNPASHQISGCERKPLGRHRLQRDISRQELHPHNKLNPPLHLLLRVSRGHESYNIRRLPASPEQRGRSAPQLVLVLRLVQPVRQRIPPLDQDTIHNTRSTVRIRRLPMDQVRG